ncbi:hypothetical protein CROQUDRAFT_87893 [Cronartium quercuum f. sp. fusiforme G11]|uniref:Uncharacterized protein n=1 Tax=Cronartium quercuum f. sp. fusiforme G11 TaxID=708437 RepID=A0A9P6NQZ0_9BASI|nr:hypothetical protein CROQUDRAFT_87893 [Cronartium quercuum f. sp. fusiforme G11]
MFHFLDALSAVASRFCEFSGRAYGLASSVLAIILYPASSKTQTPTQVVHPATCPQSDLQLVYRKMTQDPSGTSRHSDHLISASPHHLPFLDAIPSRGSRTLWDD